MPENENDPLIGLGGGTGLMELSVSADSVSAENVMPPDHEGSARNAPAMMIGGRTAPNETKTVQDGPPSLWRMVHGALRGRYLLVITTGIIFGGMLGAVAWRKTRPSFESEGLVRIAYSLPQVREETDQNQPLSMFETFMMNQKTMIASHRVIEKAVNDPIWAANHRSAPSNPDQYFADNLAVEIKARSELIRISVSDPDPRMAAYGVTSIVNAYADLYNSQENQLEQKRLGLLESRQTDLNKQINDLTDKIRVKAADYGTTRLDSFYDAIALRRSKLEAAMTDIHMAIAGAATQPATNNKVGLPSLAEQPGDLSVEQIAAIDPVMRAYWSDQERLQAEMDRLAISYGPAHRVMVAARQDLETSKLRVKQYANLYRQTHTTSPVSSDPNNSTLVNTNRPLDSLWTTERSLSSLLDKTKQEMVTVGNTKLDLDQMETELDSTRTELAGLNHRIEVLRGEGALGGRLSVISAGEVSLQPASNHRTQLVSAAALTGALMPAGAMFLLSLVRRRYRYSDDAVHDSALSDVPLLGMLPEIKSGDNNYSQMVAAGYGVHHLRLLLGSRANKGRRTYLVTSATEGEGKTSVAVALAVSFAAAKQRTLIIDCDFVGRKTTQGFRAQNQDGLYEAMEERNISDRVIQATPFLHVLPAGRATPADACGITAAGIRNILAQLKEFDVVLIDSGSILESLEASILAQEVDAVVLAITRGQNPGMVAQAVRRLHALGSHIIGSVFNRANTQDFQCDAEPTAQFAIATKGALVEMSDLQRSVTNFGPLVRAVAITVPANS